MQATVGYLPTVLHVEHGIPSPFQGYLHATCRKPDWITDYIRGGERITDIEYFVMNVQGEVRTVPKPSDSLAFLETLGTPLSLRATWADFLHREACASEVQTLAIQDGYFWHFGLCQFRRRSRSHGATVL